MAGELRLAQRQGLLCGRHLSPVQFKASVILDWSEHLERVKQATESELLQVKAALVSSGEWKPQELFRDWFPAPTNDEDEDGVPKTLDVETEEGKLGVDYSEVTWKSGREAQEEYEALMRQVQGLSSGSVNGVVLRRANREWR